MSVLILTDSPCIGVDGGWWMESRPEKVPDTFSGLDLRLAS